MTTRRMFNCLVSAQSFSYAPYSNFRVAACVYTGNRYYVGCNVENAAYPEGLCAEASAIASMVANGEYYIQEIGVLGGDDINANLCTPCGGCRQKIREFADHNTLIHLFNLDGYQATYKLDELLPLSFGPDHL